MDKLALRNTIGLVFDEFEDRLAKAHALPILVIAEGRDHEMGNLHVQRAPYCPPAPILAAMLRKMADDLEQGKAGDLLPLVVPCRR